ncbi:MAG: glycosyltransferase family 4 protein [Paracoccaceae bacterium]
MKKNYYFLCPDSPQPSGGIAVIYDIVATLVKKGVSAAVLHGASSGSYQNNDVAVPSFFNRQYDIARMRFEGRRALFLTPLRLAAQALKSGPLKYVDILEGDCIVVPEIMCVAAMAAFPKQRIVVLVQNQLAFREIYFESLKHGFDIRNRVDCFIGVSQSCLDEFELLGLDSTLFLHVSMKPEEFPFKKNKKKIISFMPRKRLTEARLIVDALQSRGSLKDFQFLPLDNMPRYKISEVLQRSVIFISLQRNESIGFPAAEAMAAGCIVVGYTGLGGREYFTTKTGIPVTEDDTLALVKAVEDIVAEYNEAPERLDNLRHCASVYINARYSSAQFEDSVLRVWQVLDR